MDDGGPVLHGLVRYTSTTENLLFATGSDLKNIQSRVKNVVLQVNVEVKIFLKLSHLGENDARSAQRSVRSFE